MDWSLVLVSQGIDTAIDHNEEAGWGLLVTAEEHERALDVLKQYRTENRRWPWRRTMQQDVLFDFASAGWVLLIILFSWLGNERAALYDQGLMDAGAVSRGEWWRLFTAVFLHADLGHLAANASIGLILLGLTMGRYGTGVGLLAAYLAGAGGNLIVWLIHTDNHRNLGASGMVMGCVGLLAAQSVPALRKGPSGWKYAVSGLAGGVMLFVLTGTAPGTDVVAHLGGFVTGILLGSILALGPKAIQSVAVNLLAGAGYTILVVLPWWLALRK